MHKTKTCRTCKLTKLLSEFYKGKNFKDGYNSQCKQCIQEYDKQRASKRQAIKTTGTKVCSFCGLDKPVIEYSKRLRAKDGLRSRCKTCDRTEEKKYRLKNPTKAKLCKIKNNYGLTKEQYLDLVKKYDRCAICKTNDKPLVIDHCHKTGRIRGMLCSLCNAGIGMLQDDTILLQQAVKYLQEN